MSTSKIAEPVDMVAALRRLSEAAVGYAVQKASHQVDDWTRRLDEIASPSGATERAVVEGAKASVTGRNPVWAAAKGAWLGASGPVRLAMVVSLVLLAVQAPVLLLLLILGFLVAGLVAAIVAGVRAAAG